MPRSRLLLQLQIIIIIIVIINVKLTTTAQCPPNYELKNGLCHFVGNRCPEEYYLHTDGLCYPINPKPCPFENITTTTEKVLPTTTTTTTTMPPTTSTTEKVLPSTTSTPMPPTTTPTQLPPPLIDELLDCPSGTVFIENNCRKIICSLGEYHQGHCLHPACPPGLVWRSKSCREPGYITTIIEIDNTITNDINESPIALDGSASNEIIYHTSTTTTTRKPHTTPSSITERTTSKNKPTSTPDYAYSCCIVVTPRICKKYGEKWVCFNRRHKRCDSRICTAPVVYLKAHEIKYEPPVLVMPPNPPIDSCSNSSCNNTDVVDCSGCAINHPEHCSSYCYRYMCPEATCNYMDLKIYCSYFPRQFGCLQEDGCLWNWC